MCAIFARYLCLSRTRWCSSGRHHHLGFPELPIKTHRLDPTVGNTIGTYGGSSEPAHAHPPVCCSTIRSASISLLDQPVFFDKTSQYFSQRGKGLGLNTFLKWASTGKSESNGGAWLAGAEAETERGMSALYLHISLYLYAFCYIYTYIHSYTYIYIYIDIYIYIWNICIYIYEIYMYIYTYTYIYI